MRFLGNKEKKQLIANLPEGLEATKKNKITQKDEIIYKNDIPFLIEIEKNILIPHLKSIADNTYKAVYVDKGAIPFVIKGADVMRPGIQKIDDNIEPQETIVVKDENFSKILAIGKSLFSSEDLKTQKKGKSVKILHYVQDKFY